MSFGFNSPSTPNRKNARSTLSHPSTTPAGPPPSYLTNPSTTPAGPPPRSVLGSSYNAGNNTFGRRGNTPGRRGFAVPQSSPPLDEDDEEDAEGDEDEAMGGVEQSKNTLMSSVMSSPRGLKRSADGEVRHSGDYPTIARGITTRAKAARVQEPDEVILRQEEILSRVDHSVASQPNEREAVIAEGVAELSKAWRQHSTTTTKEGGLGPATDDALTKANYLSSLLLQLHHPHSLRPNQPSRQQRLTTLTKRHHGNICAIPRALLDWLDTYHHPFPDEFETIHRHQPSPADHERFWDTVYFALTRGRYDRAIRLLKDAGWENAFTAEEDLGKGTQGYSGRQLDNIEEVVERCTNVLETCPGLRYDDWDVKGGDWIVFRQRVRQAIKDLENFAGDDDEEADVADPSKPKLNIFALSTSLGGSMSMSTVSKRANSKVPWTIYENLKLLYGTVLGNVDELLDSSQDWLEASLYLTIWWDGEDAGGAALSKSSLRRSLAGSQKTREVDVAPSAAYRKRLHEAFELVSESDDAVFQPDTLDPIQVGLACIMVDSPESIISLLRSWSLPLADGVVEIAALAGWLPQSRQSLLEQGFSSEDLMVLSHGAPSQQQGSNQGGELQKDEVLTEYADALAVKDVIKSGADEREGWELAVSVLGRMDDEVAAQSRIGDLLDRIELVREERVDKVLDACRNLDLTDHARAIAERFADALASTPNPDQNYGAALIYYARAHATTKLKSTLALLTSLSLLHSAALPAQQNIDEKLAGMLSPERPTLVHLAESDIEAATLLAGQLSGYATLRHFYDLRDQDRSTGPLERKRKAATALLAVLSSGADCIRGGLFDPSIETVVPVDGVLVLLGEALPLLGQPKRIFTKEQVFALLRIVEDFATAPGRIRENAEALLQASLNAYHGNTDTNLLKKSRSDLSKSSGLSGSSYDMLAESVMTRSQSSSGKGKGGNSVVDVQRAWDWRKGLDGVEGSVGGKEVLVLVRVALAQEVGRGWGGVVDWSG